MELFQRQRRSGVKNKRNGKAESGMIFTSSQEDMQNATQLKGPIMPITQAVNTIEFVDVQK